jgi:divinyl chlorophyllide a 8-vinyl-reductase
LVKSPKPRRILMLGATGTIGRATVRELLARGYEVVCFSRSEVEGAEFRGERFDAVVSCMASRSGLPRDAWAVDYQAHLNVLEAAQKAGVRQFVLLSAICVQKPVLEFQHAKLAFEAKLIASGMTYSIVRPTAYFKSLSGQVARVQKGKPFLLFGDGRLTACKPISDRDLASFIANCLDDPKLQNAILPIGGPGPAMTPREQGEQLFALLGRKPKFKQVPMVMMSAIIRVLSILGFKDKAELARIGRYYATESMLVWDPVRKRYDADATPSFGTDKLWLQRSKPERLRVRSRPCRPGW